MHEQVVRLRHALNAKQGSLPEKTVEVLRSEFTVVDPAADLKKYNADFRARNSSSASHIISAIKTARFLAEADAGDGTADGSDISGPHAKDLLAVLYVDGIQHDQAEECLGLLRQWGRADDAETFKSKAHEKWPEVTSFS